MPSLWSGSITFGLVSIPVRLETSQKSKSLSFNLLHGECRHRVSQKYYCSQCETYVERKDLQRGYQYEKDHYVLLEPGDFEKAEGEASRNIEVIGFVDRSAVMAAHLNRTYYLVPEEGAEKGYLLLLRGMQETDTLAMTRFVMRGKEYIGAVGFAERGLLLHILFHKGEFKRLEDVVRLPEVKINAKELGLAKQIIDNLTEDFSEEMLADQYRDRLMGVIQHKLEGEEITVAEKRRPAKVVDLMQALKRSLEATAPKKPAARAGRTKSSSVKSKKARRKRA